MVVARAALRQVARCFDKLPKQLINRDSYIVHFLTSLPKANDPRLPKWVMKRFDDLRGEALKPMNLELFYASPERYRNIKGYLNHACVRCHSSAVYKISSIPNVDAVIVKLRRRRA
jgi:hypothetical protein